MATIKSYTDLEQSKKLAKILPLDTADQCFLNDGTAIKAEINSYSVAMKLWKEHYIEIIPCWSLAALISILPDEIKHDGIVNNLWITSEDASYYSKEYDSYLYYEEGCTIDACYKLILKLHELKKL